MSEVKRPNAMLKEAMRLHDLGFGVHWLRPNSKAPVKSNWTDGKRETINQLTASYDEAYGLGVKLGEASRFHATFLANIDVDIKSPHKHHKVEALTALEKIFPGIKDSAPSVKTGYGFRFFFRTKGVFNSRKLASSSEVTKVFMPNSPVSAPQLKARDNGLITQEELNSGYRVRTAWEIELMSHGRQVVLPPTIHPDTGKPYTWIKGVWGYQDLPLAKEDFFPGEKIIKEKSKSPAKADIKLITKYVYVDLLDPRFSERIINLICGYDVTDCSSAAFSVSIAMVKAGFSDDEIISLLTDRSYFIGDVGYKHANTENRDVAARWVQRYCLAKVKAEVAPEAVFNALGTDGPPIPENKVLSKQESDEQSNELIKKYERWQDKLRYSPREGALLPNLWNTIVILENAVAPDVFKFDKFFQAEIYGTDAPWTGAEAGVAVTDKDVIAIKAWFAQNYKIEPSTGVIFEAVTEIAHRNEFHMVQEELLALPPWDGKERFKGWLKNNFGAQGPDEYLDQVFKKWLVASVARTFVPGTKFDWMPIFEGHQQMGKSSFGKILFGGHKYVSDKLPNLADKDAALALRGKRCIEFSELESFKRNEIETVKGFISREVDTVRPPFGRKEIELKRGVVFFGTTNNERYLIDETGNRRFNPVYVDKLNFKALLRDRDQLWAEALHTFQFGGELDLELDSRASHLAVEIRKSKMVTTEANLMAERLIDWFESEFAKTDEERFNFQKFAMAQLFDSMGPLSRWRYDNRNAQFAGRALTKLGASKRHVRGIVFWSIDPLTFNREP
jgi:predicted P-loop ATPase